MDSNNQLVGWSGERRLFFGVAPPAPQRDALQRLLLQLSAPFVPVLASNLHLTLRFLGQVGFSQAMALCQQLDELVAEAPSTLAAFAVRLDAIECWSGPKVLCLSGDLQDPALVALDQRLDQLALAHGLAPRQHPLRPHITLARHARSLPTLQVTPVAFSANEFHLYHSESTADGVRYRVLATWPLSDGQEPVRHCYSK